jgi:hypothetical protein
MQRQKCNEGPREEERKRGSHISITLSKVLHSFGKVPVKEFLSRTLAMVAVREKQRRQGSH